MWDMSDCPAGYGGPVDGNAGIPVLRRLSGWMPVAPYVAVMAVLCDYAPIGFWYGLGAAGLVMNACIILKIMLCR